MDNKDIYDTITNVDDELLDRSLNQNTKSALWKWVIPVAAALVLIAVSVTVFFALWERPGTDVPVVPESSTEDPGRTENDRTDRLFSAVPVEAPIQWESDRGLTLLSAINGPAENSSGEPQTEMSARYPEYMLLSGDGVSAVSRTVSVSVLSGVKVSRMLSGRFFEMTYKPDAMTGLDTSEFGDFEGTYYDLTSGDLICVGYEIAKLINTDREDEIEEIFLMIASMQVSNANRTISGESIEPMYSLYVHNVDQYNGNYPGWQSLRSDFPVPVAGRFGWTDEQYELLHTLFLTGKTDLNALKESLGYDYKESTLQLTLDKCRNRALHDGVGEVKVLYLEGEGNYAFVTRTETKTVSSNCHVLLTYAILYDREQKTLTTFCGPEDEIVGFSLQRGCCVLNPETTVAGVLSVAVTDRNRGVVHLYDAQGNHRLIERGIQKENGAMQTVTDVSLCGAIVVSPSGRYACSRIQTDDDHPSERCLLYTFSATDNLIPRILEGTFVRFARDDSVVVCRTDEGYRLYSTQSGLDVTEQFHGEEALSLASHEYYDLVETNGGLFRVHILTGETDLLAQTDSYDAYVTDPYYSCVYLASASRKSVDCILLSEGSSAYSIAIDTAFLNEVGPRDIVSLNCAESGAMLILSHFRPANVMLDEEKLIEKARKISSRIGFLEKLEGGFFGGVALPAIQYGDVYLNTLRNEDPNVTKYPLDRIGLYLTLPLVRKLIADDMLLTEEDLIEVAWEFAEKVVAYIDIDADGTVRLAAGALEELFGIEMNIGQAFYKGEWLPFLQTYGRDSPDYLNWLADANVRNVLEEDPALTPGIPEETVTSFISLVAKKLSQACASHYSSQYNLYEGFTYSDLLLLKEKVRTWTTDWLAEYDVDPETVSEYMRTASLDGLSKYVPMTEEEKQAAGIG